MSGCYCSPCPLPVCCPRRCCPVPGNQLCCRLPWDISPPRPSRFVDFCVAPLACRSNQYNCWLSNFGPKTDTNLCSSLYSSRVENSGYNMVAVQPQIEYDCSAPPCPCHF